MTRERPIRVAIVGGGCAGLTTALELTSPALRGRYEVTVYQMGWRLGGKGASSRGVNDRIEEHGIHLWMGCYENAFRMIRQVYAENAPGRTTSPIKTWREAFLPLPHIGLGQRHGANWDIWSAHLPPLPGLPGDPFESARGSEHPFSVLGYLRRAGAMMVTLLETAIASPGRHGRRPQETQAWHTPENLLLRVERVVLAGLIALRSPARILEAVRLQLALLNAATPASFTLLGKLAGLVAEALSNSVSLTAEERDGASVSEVLELLAVGFVGCLRDGVHSSPQGFEVLDEFDFVEWIRHHGASEQCATSPFVRGIYSLALAFEGGDERRPAFSAGVFMRVCLRMFFTYRGSLFWRMAAGMGEIVFSPMYEVLRERGVKFEFFHRLRNVALADGSEPGGSRVRALEFDVQAVTRGGHPYAPLIDVRGLSCWPAEPLWGQLDAEPGSADFESPACARVHTSTELLSGRDFDLAVLAIGLGAVPSTCRELIDRHPSWKAMTDHVKTVATQAFQLWMRPALDELGWTRGPVASTAFAPPFDSWTDMSDLISWETWPEDDKPQTLAYFCNVLSDDQVETSAFTPDGGNAAHACVRRSVLDYLDHHIGSVWPHAVGPDGGFRWDFAVGPQGASQAHPVDSQYMRANFNPSDRYVLSVPGSGKFRISPLDRECENLTIAGDWTACGIDAGCIEAAVISGRLAAHAITGEFPSCEDIVGYHHP